MVLESIGHIEPACEISFSEQRFWGQFHWVEHPEQARKAVTLEQRNFGRIPHAMQNVPLQLLSNCLALWYRQNRDHDSSRSKNCSTVTNKKKEKNKKKKE